MEQRPRRAARRAREGGAGAAAASPHMAAKGGPAEPRYLTHTHCVHTLQTKNRSTQAAAWRKRRDPISAKEFPIISVTHTKSPSATGDRKDAVNTLVGQSLTRSAAATTMFNFSFKFWNLTCKKGYSASMWRTLRWCFQNESLIPTLRLHFGSLVLFWFTS